MKPEKNTPKPAQTLLKSPSPNEARGPIIMDVQHLAKVNKEKVNWMAVNRCWGENLYFFLVTAGELFCSFH
jgi:hypothetical protein